PRDEEHFTVSVKVALSPQFLGWIAGLEGAVTVAAPEKALEKMRELAEKMQEQYLK
ncbi:MAG: WYL domain-containing protein, partial [Oscillospiraceae bacterium]|nr:WYL domain-containing protein [Oscillospiraceae bacterium]